MTCLARLHATPPGKQATTQQPQPIALGGGARKFQHFQDFCQSTKSSPFGSNQAGLESYEDVVKAIKAQTNIINFAKEVGNRVSFTP